MGMHRDVSACLGIHKDVLVLKGYVGSDARIFGVELVVNGEPCGKQNGKLN